jgi:hypothetical protein
MVGVEARKTTAQYQPDVSYTLELVVLFLERPLSNLLRHLSDRRQQTALAVPLTRANHALGSLISMVPPSAAANMAGVVIHKFIVEQVATQNLANAVNLDFHHKSHRGVGQLQVSYVRILSETLLCILLDVES